LSGALILSQVLRLFVVLFVVARQTMLDGAEGKEKAQD
jgi:hypothetical protein